MERKLASVQIIERIDDIPGADKIGMAQILGWHVIVRKDEFHAGDKCVFFEVDAVLPPWSQFAFLEKQNYRVKVMKMRGVISQGLAMPFSTFPIIPAPSPELFDYKLSPDLPVGLDLTGILKVVKYEIPDEYSGTQSEGAGKFPGFIPQTDEIRLQTVPDVLKRHVGTEFYVTEKLDGSSFTGFKFNGQFSICSRARQVSLDPEKGGSYAKAALKYHLAENLPEGYAIQAEMVGPKIQKNKYGLSDVDLYVFSVFQIKVQKFLDYENARQFAESIGLKFVPFLYSFTLDKETVDDFVLVATGPSKLNRERLREGIVVRSTKEDIDIETGRLSFKVHSPEFALQWNEPIATGLSHGREREIALEKHKKRVNENGGRDYTNRTNCSTNTCN
jgi:RNA ligase (TIGR02306 family)